MTSDLIEQTLFERNLAVFKKLHPSIHHALLKVETPSSRLTGSLETGDVNLDLGHTAFYATDAASHAQAQLDEFRAAPKRFYMDPPIPGTDPQFEHQRFSVALYKHLQGEAIAEVPLYPTKDAGYLLIYGLGLGFHIAPLIDEIPAEHIIIMEEFIEFLHHSLHLHDWGALFERAAERGQMIKFIFGPEPGMVADECHWHMRGAGFGLLDGSYIFRHYQSLLLDQAHAQFAKDLPLLPVSIGFFEDEMVMLHNCGRNLLNQPFRLLDSRPRTKKDVPVLIVGSGPSFDQSVEILKELRPHAILFSCGTGLSNLLRHGIRPDFHCELENVFGSYEHLRKVRETYGSLEDITLIASNTVYPLTPGLFGRSVFYFRDAVSSTAQWCPDKNGISGTAPTVTNLGIRAALLMSFREIYLFGVDLGTRDKTRHHSDAAIYATDKEWASRYAATSIMTIPMPANFGGQAYTTEVLHWARMLMIQAIAIFSRGRIYNCSDGVKITGTLPRLPKTVKLTTPPARCRQIFERTMLEMEDKAAGDMISLDDLTETHRELDEWSESLSSLADEAIATNMSFLDFYKAALPFLAFDGERKHQRTIRAIYIGTLMMSFQMTYYYYRRLAADRQSALMAAYLTELKIRLAAMKEIVGKELDDLDAMSATRVAA